MIKFVHNILGTDYTFKLGTREEIDMSENNQGECKIFSKEIKVCTDPVCSDRVLDEKELIERTKEILAHEIFHAYCNECGLDVSDDTEEVFAIFFMKVWKKMYDSINSSIRCYSN